MAYPRQVRLVEVGPRDGLQNEPMAIALEDKIALIERLAAAGLPSVEAGAFVSPKKVPQMADSAEIFRRLARRPGTAYPALVPNMAGFEAASAAGVEEIAVFVSASEGFSRRNIGCSMDESLDRLAPVAEAATQRGLSMRGYVSCVIACPFDGPTAPERAVAMAARLFDLGCYEISLGDTIGVGTAEEIRRLVTAASERIPRHRLALHLHDSFGQGVANVLVGLEEGISVFDSAVAGLGGCPFAPGATGNVATEDLLYLLDGLGIETGVDLLAVAGTGAWISEKLGRPNASKAGRALLARRRSD